PPASGAPRDASPAPAAAETAKQAVAPQLGGFGLSSGPVSQRDADGAAPTASPTSTPAASSPASRPTSLAPTGTDATAGGAGLAATAASESASADSPEHKPVTSSNAEDVVSASQSSAADGPTPNISATVTPLYGTRLLPS